jgi:hypothetical protein
VSRVASVPMPQKPVLKVSLAYDIPRGDPLRNWSPLDFEISNKNGGLTPNGIGINAHRIQGNILQLSIVEENFNFSVSGFDRHRDLLVRVDDISGDSESADDEPTEESQA